TVSRALRTPFWANHRRYWQRRKTSTPGFTNCSVRCRQDLLEEFERHRPMDRNCSPMSFTFNFPQNLSKAIVVDALLRGEPWNLTLNDLLSGIPRLEPIDPLRREAGCNVGRIRALQP